MSHNQIRPTLDHATFRSLGEKWMDLDRRNKVVMAQVAALGLNSPLLRAREEEMCRLDREFRNLEATIAGIVMEAVGPAPAAVRAGGYLFTLALDGGELLDERYPLVAVVDLDRITTLEPEIRAA